MTKVYVVTSGGYINYSIEEVFSTKEKAAEYIAKFGKDYDLNNIEEYEVKEEVNTKEYTCGICEKKFTDSDSRFTSHQLIQCPWCRKNVVILA